jgi:voltage-gated potassium channel
MKLPDYQPAPDKKHQIRYHIYEIIFKADTPAGKFFDLALIGLIVLSVAIVIVESIEQFHIKYFLAFQIAEWTITIAFTIEYLLRTYVVRKPLKYIFSFYGIIDFLAILPTYMSIIFAGSQYLSTIRALRLLRIFRILKLNRYISESNILIRALLASRIKITLFISSVLTVLLIIGSAMYFVEGDINPGFTNIPNGIYWAIVTLTTVGYGDIVPFTPLGRLMASFLMILGYAIIAVPTGIVTSEMINYTEKGSLNKKCNSCSFQLHDSDALYCKRCGTHL